MIILFLIFSTLLALFARCRRQLLTYPLMTLVALAIPRQMPPRWHDARKFEERETPIYDDAIIV